MSWAVWTVDERADRWGLRWVVSSVDWLGGHSAAAMAAAMAGLLAGASGYGWVETSVAEMVGVWVGWLVGEMVFQSVAS